MSEFEYLYRLTVLAVLAIASFLAWLCYSYAGMVNSVFSTGLWSVELSVKIVAYSLPVAALLAIGLTGYLAVFKSYFTVKNWEAMTRLQWNEAEAVGFSVHSVSAKKSAVIVAPHTSPVLLTHPKESPLPLASGETDMPCVVDVMARLDRVLLIGGTGSGKTELMKHYVTRLAQNGNRLTIVDPHSPSKLAGIDVIGARLNFKEIESFMVETIIEVDSMYANGQIDQSGDMGKLNEWLIIEEFKDIHDQLGEIAEEFLKIMLVRARKTGKRFTIVSQNDSIASLGLEGDKGLLKGCERVEIKKDILTDKRSGHVGWLKSDRVVCSVPGKFSLPYATIPASQLVIEQPTKFMDITPTQKQLALTIARLNGQARAMSRNELLKAAGVSKNTANLAFIDQILGN